MKITELIKNERLSLSFEVFPPKTDTAFESVKAATEEIAELHPAFMSVTYGAGGGTSKYTLDIAKNIKELYGVPTLEHLTCVSSTKETVKQKIAEIKGITPDEVLMIENPYALVMLSGKPPAITNIPDISKMHFNKLNGMGTKEENLKLRLEREQKRDERPISPIKVWDIWNKGTKERESEIGLIQNKFHKNIKESYEKNN